MIIRSLIEPKHDHRRRAQLAQRLAHLFVRSALGAGPVRGERDRQTEFLAQDSTMSPSL